MKKILLVLVLVFSLCFTLALRPVRGLSFTDEIGSLWTVSDYNDDGYMDLVSSYRPFSSQYLGVIVPTAWLGLDDLNVIVNGAKYIPTPVPVYVVMSTANYTVSNGVHSSYYADVGIAYYQVIFTAWEVDFSEDNIPQWTAGGVASSVKRFYDLTLSLDVPNAYNEGYQAGVISGRLNGMSEGYGDGYSVGVVDGYDNGYDDGYNEAVLTDDPFTPLLAFVGLPFTLLEKELFPGLTVGMVASVPIVLGLISLLIGLAPTRIKGGK